MRGLVLAAVVMGSTLYAAHAQAEKVHTNATTKLFAKPGEKETVLFTVKSGQAMTVLSKDGRWLKVRFSGRTGYIPRSKVDLPEGSDDIQRNTRRRPFVDGRTTKRGFGADEGTADNRVGADATGAGGGSDSDDSDDSGGDKKKKPAKKPEGKKKHPKGGDDGDDSDDSSSGDKSGDDDVKATDEGDQRPTAHVTESTTIHEKPNKSSDVAFKAKPSQQLFVEDTKGKWTEVSVEEGDIGWVLTDKLDIDDSGDGGGGPRKRMMDLRARGGVMIISQGVRTTGGKQTVPDNYNIGTSAAAIDLGGGVVYPYDKDYYIGAELAYQYALAIPGVPYKDPTTMVTSTTGFTVHDLDLRAVGGYDLHNKRGMVVWARLGFRYQSYLVANVTDLTKNTARIPSETFKSPTIGAALSIPRMTPTIGLNFHLDLAAVGTSVSQTKNLEDGATPSGKMYCLGAIFTYKWKPDINIAATYDLALASYDFGAPMATSMRNHTGTDVTRSDTFHILTVGINKAF